MRAGRKAKSLYHDDDSTATAMGYLKQLKYSVSDGKICIRVTLEEKENG